MSENRLEHAIELIQLGKIDEAQKVLEQLIKADRSNIAAWHWYAETWSKTPDKIRVWEVCLRNNPSNEQAKQALANLNPNPIKTQLQPSKTPSPNVNSGNPRSSQWLVWGAIGAFVVVAVLAVFIISNARPKNPEEYRHTQPVEYYLYAPKDYTDDKDWPLFIGIHGSGGSGLECWNLWQSYADKEGFILLCPSIPGDAYGYRLDVGEQTVWSAIGEVKKEYRVRSRMFLTGFSAGAFFIQGFNYHYPQYVTGLSILSPGVYFNPAEFPSLIPIAVVIGEADDPRSVDTSQLFVDELRKYGFDVQYERLPGVGHTVTKKGVDVTIELFRETISK